MTDKTKTYCLAAKFHCSYIEHGSITGEENYYEPQVLGTSHL